MAVNHSDRSSLCYLTGFGNELASEAEAGALPERGNNPKACPFGLYAEQLSGTAFTVPRSEQRRTWLYRILPSVHSSPKIPYENSPRRVVSNFKDCIVEPSQLRWRPFEIEKLIEEQWIEGPTNFVHGMFTLCGSGSVSAKSGFAIHMYVMNADMEDTAFVNADGDYLFVPQQGALLMTTECGRLKVCPGEICVVPRGMAFAVKLLDPSARGYMIEVFEGHFKLPDLGPIGANGLANPRDFEYPVAWYEDRTSTFTSILKFQGKFFTSMREHSPFDVVAWHGNYLPFKYDLSKFCPVNAVLYDHSDPSIFTVLTVPSAIAGVAVVDFVVFPPRWLVAENTFRPPYFHRNCMNEFMGSIKGSYDAKEGFRPGCASLHVCMTPHGPDRASYLANVDPSTDAPARIPDTSLAFMFETNNVPLVTPFALLTDFLETDYTTCWSGFERRFSAAKHSS